MKHFGRLLPIALLALSRLAFGQTVAPGASVTLSAPVTLTAACSACNVFLTLQPGAIAQANQTGTFVAGKATQVTATFAAPAAAGTYTLYYTVFPTAAGSAMAGQGSLGTVTVQAALVTPPPVSPPVAGTGSVTLKWSAPTTNTNGTPIADALSYNVYSGASSSSLTKVGNVSALTDVVTNLTAGTYYWAVTAVDTVTGSESAQAPAPNSITIAAAPAAVPNSPTSVSLTCTLQVGSGLTCTVAP